MTILHEEKHKEHYMVLYSSLLPPAPPSFPYLHYLPLSLQSLLPSPTSSTSFLPLPPVPPSLPPASSSPCLYLLLKVVLHPHHHLTQLVPLLSQAHHRVLCVPAERDSVCVCVCVCVCTCVCVCCVCTCVCMCVHACVYLCVSMHSQPSISQYISVN